MLLNSVSFLLVSIAASCTFSVALSSCLNSLVLCPFMPVEWAVCAVIQGRLKCTAERKRCWWWRQRGGSCWRWRLQLWGWWRCVEAWDGCTSGCRRSALGRSAATCRRATWVGPSSVTCGPSSAPSSPANLIPSSPPSSDGQSFSFPENENIIYIYIYVDGYVRCLIFFFFGQRWWQI